MAQTNLNIAGKYPAEARRLRLVLVLTLFFLGVGLMAPIITLKKFVLIENTFSVFSGAIELLKNGQILLFIIIAGFSIILPLLKIVVLNKLPGTKAYKTAHLNKYLHWMHLYGKWSMLDVFVVAVMVVTVKLGVIASVEVRYGLYSFVAAVVLTMYVTARVVRLTSDQASAYPGSK